MSDCFKTGTELDTGPLNPENSQPKVRHVVSRPLEVLPDATVYNMTRNLRKAVIFNHSNFKHSDEDLKPRPGTEHDVSRLNTLLPLFKFTVTVYDNLTKTEIMAKLEDLQKEDYNNCDLLAIFVLSHGRIDRLAANDKYYNTEDLWSYFSSAACPTMAGKPKLIFINACRGLACDFGAEFVGDLTTDASPSDNSSLQIVYHLPNNADILIAFSTFDGFISNREPDDGSWFIQALCDVLEDDEMNQLEIQQLLNRVKQKVALRKSTNQYKQIPVVVSSLIRDLYLS